MFRIMFALFGFMVSSLLTDITPDGGAADEGTTDEGTPSGDEGATGGDPGGEQDGGATDDTGDAGEGGDGDGSGDDGDGGESGDGDGDGDGKDAKYTDDDLTHHKAEARKSARSKILKDLGVKTLEEAKRLLGVAEESAGFREVADRRIVRAEARALAVDAGVRKDRVQAVLDHADFSEAKVSDDGEVNAEKIRGALAKVLETYPEWGKASTGRAPGGRGDETPAPTGIDAEIAEAKAAGNYRKAEQLHARKLRQEGKVKFPGA